MRTVHTSMTSTFQRKFYCISLNDNISTFDFSIDFSIFHPLFDVPLKLHAKETKQKRKKLLVRLLLPSVLKEIDYSCEDVLFFVTRGAFNPFGGIAKKPKSPLVPRLANSSLNCCRPIAAFANFSFIPLETGRS